MEKERTYNLDLLTLIESLNHLPATLTATLPKGSVPGVFEPCKGYIRIRDGEIIGSSIIGKSGPQVSGARALQYLRDMTTWHVKLDIPDKEISALATSNLLPPIKTEDLPVSSPPSSPQTGPITSPAERITGPHTPLPSYSIDPSMQIVYALGPIPSHLLNRLPSRDRIVYRMVYTMINGARSLKQIKEQLHISEETVDYVISELERHNVIEIR